jgi:hypothetical protein
MILQQLSDFGQSWEDYGRFNLRTDHRLNLIETPFLDIFRHIPTLPWKIEIYTNYCI